MARPSKFTPERAKMICDNLRIGCTRKAAVGSVGVCFDSFLNWVRRYPSFSTDVSRAEDEAERRFTGVVAQAAQPRDVIETVTVQGPKGITTTTTQRREFDWRAAESWLKRRRRGEWGDSIDVRKLDDDTLLRLLGITERSDTEGTPISDAEYAREG